MGGFDTEIGAAGGVAQRPRFGAAHGLGTYLFVLGAQWTAGYMVVAVLTAVAAIRGRDVSNERVVNAVMAQAVAPVEFVYLVVMAFVTLMSLRLFAWHLVRDRTPAGLGLFVPPVRLLVLWSAIGLVLGAAHAAMMQLVPAASEPSTMSSLASQTTLGHVSYVTSVVVSPFLSSLLFEGVVFRGVMESWGVKAASLVVVVLYVAGTAMDVAGNWPMLIAAVVIGAAAVGARVQTGSVIASFAMSQAYVVVLMAAWYGFIRNP